MSDPRRYRRQHYISQGIVIGALVVIFSLVALGLFWLAIAHLVPPVP
jgi:hypothetical protein